MKKLIMIAILAPLASIAQYEITTVGYNVLQCPISDEYIEQENGVVIQANTTAISHLYINEGMTSVKITSPIATMSGYWKLKDVYIVQSTNGILIGGDITKDGKSMLFQVSGSGHGFWMTSYYPDENGYHYMYNFLGY